MSKAAQRFPPRRTEVRRRRKTRGERRSSEKGPFPDGNELGLVHHRQYRCLAFFGGDVMRGG